MNLVFSASAEREFADVVARYPRREAALLPVLWLAQREFGRLGADERKFVAEKLGLSLARVESVVSFYTMYRTRPAGTYHIQVCRTLSCNLRGCERLFQTVEGEIGVKPGETTADGIFTYEQVECLGACGGAPVVRVNDDYHENLTPDEMKALIGKMRGDGKDR
jgi:NADH-quinone oxidoreductase E subunit